MIHTDRIAIPRDHIECVTRNPDQNRVCVFLKGGCEPIVLKGDQGEQFWQQYINPPFRLENLTYTPSSTNPPSGWQYINPPFRLENPTYTPS